MPYDATDAETIAAIAEITSELEAEHAKAVKGLKDKNAELLAKIKKGEHADPVEIERLEAERDKLAEDLAAITKTLKDTTKERDKLAKTAETETALARKLLIDGGLTAELVKHNIAPQFLPAAKALLAGQVTVETEGENRVVKAGGKSLGDFVKEWSLGDEGKHYVAAASNNGGNAPGGHSQGGTTKKFQELNETQRTALFSKVGNVEFKRLQDANAEVTI